MKTKLAEYLSFSGVRIMRRTTIYLALTAMLVGLLASCAGDVELIDRTQPNKVEKKIFSSDHEWFFRPIVIETQFNQGLLFEGLEGEMDRVRITSRNGQRAVALEGETLIGGAQNRIINAGAVIDSGREMELPSSCGEVHRWDCLPGRDDPVPPDKRNFGGSDHGFGSLRRLKMDAAVHSLRSDRRVNIEQKIVWEHIVKQCVGPAYGWMWPFPKVVRGWIDAELDAIRDKMS